MRVENLVVLRDISGCEYVQFFEDPTKTRQSGLRPNRRTTDRKMFLLEEKDVLLDYLKCIYQNGLMI